MIDGQVVDEEAGVTVDQSGGGLKLAGLAFDQGTAGIIELSLTGRPVAEKREQLAVNVIEGLGELVRLKRGRDRERSPADAGNRTDYARRR